MICGPLLDLNGVKGKNEEKRKGEENEGGKGKGERRGRDVQNQKKDYFTQLYQL